MKKIVLAGACRTAIGTMGGALSTVPAAELGSVVIKEALNRCGTSWWTPAFPPSRSTMFTWAALSRLVWARMSPVRLP